MGIMAFVFICLNCFSIFKITNGFRAKRYYIPIFMVSLLQVLTNKPELNSAIRISDNIILFPGEHVADNSPNIHFCDGGEVQNLRRFNGNESNKEVEVIYI